MPHITVWAPHAHTASVELYPSGERIAMIQADDSLFTSPESFPVGTRYFIALDNGPALPDPRSRRQPLGVHGPSEIIDPALFHWTDASWHAEDARGKVFYELHIGTFSEEGTFLGAVSHLDHLVDLGVDVVEIMPINPIPGRRGWGYDGVSTMAIFEDYGTPEEFAALVDALHSRGLYACLDVVYNHFGPEGNYTGSFGPYTSSKHQTPWGAGMNLDDDGSDQVRKFFVDNIVQWARDYHIDVFRMDAVDYLCDNSPHHIIAEITDALANVSREMRKVITVTVESDANDVMMTSPVADGGKGVHAQWVDDVHHALHVWLTGETNAYYSEYTAQGTLTKALTQGFVHDGIWTNFDKRIRGTQVPGDLDGHRFIVFDENHDQVGNRLIGDRPSARLSQGELAISRTLILLSHFTPMLFMGEEWGTAAPFPFFSDLGPEVGPLIKEGRKNEFASWDLESVYGELTPSMPDPQDRETFIHAKLDWSELKHEEYHEFYTFVKKLIELRHSDPVFTSGDRSHTEVSIGSESGWMRRGNWLIVFSKHAGDVRLPDMYVPGITGEPVLAWGAPRCTDGVVHFDKAGVAILQYIGAS